MGLAQRGPLYWMRLNLICVSELKHPSLNWIPATVLFKELQTQGYDGQEGLVKIYVRQFKTGNKRACGTFRNVPGKTDASRFYDD